MTFIFNANLFYCLLVSWTEETPTEQFLKDILKPPIFDEKDLKLATEKLLEVGAKIVAALRLFNDHYWSKIGLSLTVEAAIRGALQPSGNLTIIYFDWQSSIYRSFITKELAILSCLCVTIR